LAIPAIAFAAVMGRLPLRVTRRIGALCGRAAYAWVPRVRRVGLSNLDLAYGDTLSPAEKKRILKRAAENVGIVAAEFSRIPRITPEFVERQVVVEGMDLIDRSQGVVLVGAHLGNWEWMATVLVTGGLRVAEVVRPLDDSALNRVIDTTRRGGGVETLARDGAGMEILRLLREGWVVGILADQSATRSAVPAQFFGHTCWATTGPVTVALRARVPVHPICMPRMPDGRYRFIVLPAVELSRTRDTKTDIVANTQRIQDVIEGLVRQYPEQWLWLHRRWKKRAGLEREWEAKKRMK